MIDRASHVPPFQPGEPLQGGAIDMAPATSPATPAIKTSFCVAAAAATPTIKLVVERMPSLSPSTAALNHPMRLTEWLSRVQRKTAHPTIVRVGSNPTHENQDEEDDQDDADDAHATVTVAVAVTAQPAAEATEQEDDEDDDKNQS